MKRITILLATLVCLASIGCAKRTTQPVQVGAERTHLYFDDLAGKRVAMLGNHTSLVSSSNGTADPSVTKDSIRYIHTLDMLLARGVNMVAVFSPEHGFRGTASAGEHVNSSVDEKTGIPILSLYSGGSARPSDEDMEMFDVLLIDIQDVGLRFYTYYITMVRLMDACADFGKQVIVLDRPNPNGYYVDGPLLDMKHKSGVGYLPIPIVHGMTLGELALMVNGEGWLSDGKQCPLKVVPCAHYTHQTRYELPVPPSPNLRNQLAIYLYPSVCLFEGTPVSLGRGTDKPFLCYGHPDMQGEFAFTPRECAAAKNPPQKDQLCRGVDLSQMSEDDAMRKHFSLEFVIDAYNQLNMGDAFFTKFFVKLTGQDYIQEMIMAGKSNEEIRAMWADDVHRFKAQRQPYLLYAE